MSIFAKGHKCYYRGMPITGDGKHTRKELYEIAITPDEPEKKAKKAPAKKKPAAKRSTPKAAPVKKKSAAKKPAAKKAPAKKKTKAKVKAKK